MEIISEIGLNHGGNLERALEMIRISKECGANVAKFQFYYPDILCANRNCFDSYKLLDKIKMHPSWIPFLAAECKRWGIEFLCTAFDRFSAEAIEMYIKRFKVASPEVADLNYLKFLAVFEKPLILSTGKVTSEQLDRIFDEIKVPIELLYCISKYPALPSDYKLSEIKRLKKRYGCKVGVSCHCAGIKNALDAVDKGADIVEKHFTLTNDTVDAAVSIYPGDMKKMCEIIRRNNER
jgi:sialic acid synthase SpsE